MKVVELYNQGYGSNHISKMLHISDSVVETCHSYTFGINRII